MRQRPFLLSAEPDSPFPPAHLTVHQPEGLLAIGGDLSVPRLLNAYRGGIFPWFSEGQPPLWWSPDPRMVFFTDQVRLSSRFRRSLRQSRWDVRADSAFDQVVEACAGAPRPGQDGTWITAGMRAAYGDLYRVGHAHSVEVFEDDALVGGIYGVAIGRMFFGESMFSGRSGGSKVALAALARRLSAWGWPLIDAQVENDHLPTLGAVSITRDVFLSRVAELTTLPGMPGSWADRFGRFPASELAHSAAP